MGSSVSTITSKFQITLPEAVRQKFQVDVGERIQWEVHAGVLVGRRLPSLSELAGCLKEPRANTPNIDESASAWAAEAVVRDRRIKGQK